MNQQRETDHTAAAGLHFIPENVLVVFFGGVFCDSNIIRVFMAVVLGGKLRTTTETRLFNEG